MMKRALSILLIVFSAATFIFSGCGPSVEKQLSDAIDSKEKPAEKPDQTAPAAVAEKPAPAAVKTAEAEPAAPAAPVYSAVNIAFNGMFSDNMVLQRGMKSAVWGTADPGGRLCVSVNGQKKEADVDGDGRWKVRLDPMEAGGPFELSVQGKESTVFKNVMVGDVWICSGQSNMGFRLSSANNAKEEITNAEYPDIRLLTVPLISKTEPQDSINSSWIVCSPETASRFSAVGYFFGRDLYKHLNIPIGLVNTSWGGTPAEAWTTYGTLESLEETKPIIERWQQALKVYPEKLKEYKEEVARFEKMQKDGTGSDRQKDPGNTGFDKGYALKNFDDGSWKSMKNPGLWEQTQKDMNIDGVVWFRRDVDIPDSMAGKELTMTLGPIDDFDITYWDNEKIGETTSSTDQWWVFPRQYTVPAEKVTKGRHVIAVRVFDHFGGGGFGGVDAQMALKTGDGTGFISLAGVWKYFVEHEQDPRALKPSRRPRAPMGPGSSWAPAGLYNAMIHPLIQYGIKGAIWYQGESNAGRAVQYRTLMKAMIRDWRRVWGQGDFPFFITQLANFRQAKADPGEDAWAELREAQNMAMELPNVGVAVTIDIGDAGDIHPRNKQDVGKRLALSARKIAYGEDIVYSGPAYDSFTVTEEGKIAVKFTSVGSGLVAKDGPLKRFAIAGEDKKFVWADAVIEGDTVVVSSPDVPKPAAVRYAWETNPEGCNLYNKEGLPASPFRTDDWPLSTEGKY